MSEIVKVVYEIEFIRQVLISGSWDSDDCEWRWKSDYEHYDSYEEAKEKFYGLELKDPYCLIDLNEIGYDRYGNREVLECLDEIC